MGRAVRKVSYALSTRLLKSAAGIVSCFVVIFGWLAGCKGVTDIFAVAYGPPPARYTVRGTVRSAETGTAIPGVRVRMEYRSNVDSERVVSMREAATDSVGAFQVKQSVNPWLTVWTLRAEDIDGAENGDYREAVISHDISEGAHVEGNTTYTVNIAMEEKRDDSK